MRAIVETRRGGGGRTGRVVESIRLNAKNSALTVTVRP